MIRGSRLIGALLAFMVCDSAMGQSPKWYQVSSQHFLLFTDTSESKGERLVTDLESRVSALSVAFDELRPMQFPIEIFAFNKYDDFQAAEPPLPVRPQMQLSP